MGESLRSPVQLLKDNQPQIFHPSKAGSKIGFSNLQGRREVREEEVVEFGDYGYEREPESDAGSHKRSGRLDEGGELSAGHVEHHKPLPKSTDVPQLPSGVKTKHQSPSWHAPEANDNGPPPDKLAEELSKRRTLFICVITSLTQLMTQTLAIQGTWAPQASKVVYFVGEVDVMPHLPHGMEVVELEGVDDGMGTWELKEIATIKYLIDHYLEDVDWFMVVSDEAYVVTETLERRLNELNAAVPVYLGQAAESSENGKSALCERHPGVLYSRTLLEALRPYLPMCWPGGQGEEDSLAGCLGVMRVRCTRAKEVSWLYLLGLGPVTYHKLIYSCGSYHKFGQL